MSDCNVIVIEGKDGKTLLSQVIIEMDLIAVCLSDEIIKIAVPSYSTYRAVFSQEKNYPIVLCRDPITNRTIIAITCPQASNLFSWKGTNFDYSLTTMLIHTRYHLAVSIKGAQYQEEFLPDFTSVDQSPLCDLNTKEGASIVTKWMDDAELIEGDKASFQSSREVKGKNSSKYMKTNTTSKGRSKDDVTEDKSRGGKNGLGVARTKADGSKPDWMKLELIHHPSGEPFTTRASQTKANLIAALHHLNAFGPIQKNAKLTNFNKHCDNAKAKNNICTFDCKQGGKWKLTLSKDRPIGVSTVFTKEELNSTSQDRDKKNEDRQAERKRKRD